MRLVRYTYPNYRSLAPLGYQRSPWSGLESEIDRLFATALSDFNGTDANRFPVDIYEDEGNVFVRAELPGVNRDEINVEMVDGYLTISATRKTAASGDQPEESFSLSRSVNIEDEIQADKVAAQYE